MTTLLFTVGIAVFFLTVFGAVLAGGHLLAEAEITETATTPARMRAEDAELGHVLRDDARVAPSTAPEAGAVVGSDSEVT